MPPHVLQPTRTDCSKWCPRAVRMEANHSVASNGVKSVGSRSKTPGLPISTRLQRNLAEKERRDKLNGYISELATLVPMVSNASKPLDKVSILRLAAAEMRLHFSCLNPKKYKKKTVQLPPSILSGLDLIEKSVGGFVIVTNLTGLIVYCSRSIEDYLGYQNIDVMGNKVKKYIYEDDLKYFESKVNSVVSSLKKPNKKKTKYIRAHMLQKPLPRSNESCRPRNMILKISVLQNDPSENGKNGSATNQSSSPSKLHPPRDFGYSAVILFYVEPVQLEPEIDITYIDSNQDVYFTRHGLQGEIIYADQRISTITGYMSHEVHGTSAYQYICSSDVPIALFAQKSMFTSTDGKGDIVYRLRIRDMRFIYLQSSGQIAYKEGSNEISHFVCLNRLLSEEEGCQELKKFQQRYAPQMLAAKNASSVSSAKDTSYEQREAVMNASMADITVPVTQINSPPSSGCEIASNFSSSIEDVNNVVMSVPDSPNRSCSMHSLETHSSISPVKSSPRSSITSDLGDYVNEQQQLEIVMEKPGRTQTLRNDCTLYPTSPYETVVSSAHEKSFRDELFRNLNSEVNQSVVLDKQSFSENITNVNESYKIQQNCQYISVKSPNKILHSVNAYNNLLCNVSVNGFRETLNDHHLKALNQTVLQKNTSCHLNFPGQNSTNTFSGSSNGLLSNSSEQQDECLKYNSLNKTKNFFNEHQKNPRLPGIRSAESDVSTKRFVTFDSEQISPNKRLHIQDTPNCTEPFRFFSETSLPSESSNYLPVISEHRDSVFYSTNESSCNENDNYSRRSLASTVEKHNSLATAVRHNGLGVSTKPLVADLCDTNGYHALDSRLRYLKSSSPMDELGSLDLEINAISKISQPVSENKIDFTDINYSENGMPSTSQIFYSDSLSHVAGTEFSVPLGWLSNHSNHNGNIDLSLNTELYQELDLFFQQFPESSGSQNSNVTKPASNFSHDNSTYS